MIREIGRAAREELEVAMNRKVFLDLDVVIDAKWVQHLGS
jgi:GTPase Era involved in 16S rRNA processing